jgi:iron complex outermembrane receptor protein
MMKMRFSKDGCWPCVALIWCLAVAAIPHDTRAQSAENNAITAADDAFGMSVGHETLGIYGEGNVRGFSPGSAGNYRIEGMYFDQQAGLTQRAKSAVTIHVGPSAQGYAFPAPTGVVDISLRPSGDKPVFAPLLSFGPYRSYGAELDAQVPLVKQRLSVAAGATYYRNHFANGGDGDSSGFGIVPRWHPTSAIEVIAFWGAHYDYSQTQQPAYVAAGSFLPPAIVRGQYPGPSWIRSSDVGTNFGVIARGSFGAWTARAAAFRSIYDSGISYQNLITIADDGTIGRTILAFPASHSASTSGEARLARVFNDGARKHQITISLRNRQVNARYGGGANANFPAGSVNAVINPPEPLFAFGALTQDRVRQMTGAASYQLLWKGLGELNIGVQRTHYIKSVANPGALTERQVSDAWLPTFSASAILTPRLSLYGSYVRGLEDAGTAPGFARNGNQVLPAIRTRQWDAGLKWVPVKGTTMIAGYFDVAKPYLALDTRNIYGSLGTETHRGFEFSLTTTPLTNLTAVAGAVVGTPRVTNTLNANEVIGVRPVGQSDTTAQLNLDYVLPFAKRLSVDTSVTYNSAIPGTVDNRVTIPRNATVTVGARYKFKLVGKPMTLRAQVFNVFNAYVYNVQGSGVYSPIDQRSLFAYLAADL